MSGRASETGQVTARESRAIARNERKSARQRKRYGPTTYKEIAMADWPESPKRMTRSKERKYEDTNTNDKRDELDAGGNKTGRFLYHCGHCNKDYKRFEGHMRGRKILNFICDNCHLDDFKAREKLRKSDPLSAAGLSFESHVANHGDLKAKWVYLEPKQYKCKQCNEHFSIDWYKVGTGMSTEEDFKHWDPIFKFCTKCTVRRQARKMYLGFNSKLAIPW